MNIDLNHRYFVVDLHDEQAKSFGTYLGGVAWSDTVKIFDGAFKVMATSDRLEDFTVIADAYWEITTSEECYYCGTTRKASKHDSKHAGISDGDGPRSCPLHEEC